MKKNLIALAVLAASGVASAQSSVTAYGLTDVWFGQTKTSATGTASVKNTVLNSGGVATSRYGFKGTEDLGGGLKANFQLEQGFNLDTGAVQTAGSSFNRQSWVGFSGGFGEVQLGKVWTSYDDIRSSANDTFNANISASFSAWDAYTDRTNNGLKYSSPVMGGLSGSITYALGEDKAPGRDASSLLSLGGQFAQGPLFVGLAYQEEKTPALKDTFMLVNASYDLKVVKLIAGYNTVKTAVPRVADVKAKEYNFGVEAPLSANLSLAGGYAYSKSEQSGRDISKARGYSAAALYSLSKRTTLYVAFNDTKVEAPQARTETKSQIYGLGVNHKF